MISITIYQDKNSLYTGFDTSGHAGYGQEGEDIVCAAVSALVINTINSIEQLTECGISCDEDQGDGFISVRIDQDDHDAQLLLASMVLGLEEMESNYSEYIDVIFKEV